MHLHDIPRVQESSRNFGFPVTQINAGFLKQLMDKVKGDVEDLDSGEETTQVAKHFESTVQHIRHCRESGDTDVYQEIRV